MPFRGSRFAAVALLSLVMGCGMRVSLGDDEGEASSDASADFDSAVGEPDAERTLDASASDEPFEAETDASIDDADVLDGDAAID